MSGDGGDRWYIAIFASESRCLNSSRSGKLRDRSTPSSDSGWGTQFGEIVVRFRSSREIWWNSFKKSFYLVSVRSAKDFEIVNIPPLFRIVILSPTRWSRDCHSLFHQIVSSLFPQKGKFLSNRGEHIRVRSNTFNFRRSPLVGR